MPHVPVQLSQDDHIVQLPSTVTRNRVKTYMLIIGIFDTYFDIAITRVALKIKHLFCLIYVFGYSVISEDCYKQC